MQQERLSSKDYWDEVHQHGASTISAGPAPKGAKSFLRGLLDERAIQYFRHYADHLLWDVLLRRCIPTVAGAKVLEVGSAPGHNLVRMKEQFGFVPYGVEYSEEGAGLNREVFAQNGIDPGNVIHADFLSEEFQRQYGNHFDVVLSMGFVEHFSDAKDVVEKHIAVLAERGCLIVTIPNLRGINYLLSRFFRSDVVRIHNTDIMRKERFRQLFPGDRLYTLLCDYFGTFSFGLFQARADSPLGLILNLGYKLQFVLNLAFRLAFRDRGAESRYFSPGLIYIGRKRATGPTARRDM